jgi:hypothetical protein
MEFRVVFVDPSIGCRAITASGDGDIPSNWHRRNSDWICEALIDLFWHHPRDATYQPAR